ncbi:MAG: septum site-determining protein MinC [bacterium]|jgi:septum formation inhibitor MinC
MAISLKQEKGKIIFKLSEINLELINSKLIELFNKGLKEILNDNNVILDLGDLGINESEFKNIILYFHNLGINIDTIRSSNPITKMISVTYGINIDAPSVINTNNKLTPKTKIDSIHDINKNFNNNKKINNFEKIFNEINQANDKNLNIVDSDVLIINKNLRSGNYIEDKRSIVVIGNINPGAEIRSNNNIIVLGKLMGIAHGGYPNNYNAFIFALNFNSSTIRIADLVGEYNEELLKNKKKDLKNVLFKISNSSIVMELIKD